jgi:transcriptional regulator with XRE-family HTH domain
MKNNRTLNQAPSDVNVGRRMRELRASSGLSIRALAEQSGLNVNTLSMIENGKTSPSVSTLQQVAAALKAPITAFRNKNSPTIYVYQSAQERQPVAFSHGTLADLALGFNRAGLEPFMVTLEPFSDSGETPIVHTGLEFVYCLDGSIVYEVEGEIFTLLTGDSLLFEARLPHRWHNPVNNASRSLLLLCPTDERDRPDERHFTNE